jgi:hypothetical protein
LLLLCLLEVLVRTAFGVHLFEVSVVTVLQIEEVSTSNHIRSMTVNLIHVALSEVIFYLKTLQQQQLLYLRKSEDTQGKRIEL